MDFKKISFAIHPLLFALFPVLFLFTHNIDRMPFSETLLPLGISTVCALVLLILLFFFIRNRRKAALIVSAFSVLFFSYGHVWELIKKIGSLKSLPFAEGYLLILWGCLLITSVYITLRTRKHFNVITNALNIMAASLILFSVIQIGYYEFRKIGIKSAKGTSAITIPEESDSFDDSPDIYYIILDGYANAVTLEELYSFDNSDFLDYLSDEGFFIATESTSNYSQTLLSLTSSLNLEYINYLSKTLGKETKNLRPLWSMIQNNEVMRFLKARGYTIIHLRSGAGPTDINKYADMDIDCGKLDEFKILLFKTTVLRPFLRELDIYGLMRKRILNTFTKIPQMARMRESTFTFAHLVTPHPPYLFDRNGRPVPKSELDFQGSVWAEKTLYINQLIYINSIVKEMVNDILSKSKNTPIIILQADHGTASLYDYSTTKGWTQPTDSMLKERFRILNAYLLPQQKDTGLYDSITPVNTFRLIFNLYFGAGYQLLEDRNYNSGYDQPLKFSDVTEKVRIR